MNSLPIIHEFTDLSISLCNSIDKYTLSCYNPHIGIDTRKAPAVKATDVANEIARQLARVQDDLRNENPPTPASTVLYNLAIRLGVRDDITPRKIEKYVRERQESRKQ